MRLEAIEKKISRCQRCPRLRTYCEEIALKRKREFRDWTYWGKPVPGFGDPQARLWVIGLAPAAHGANRTGRMFTGDSSGNWLYAALHRHGFANQATATSSDDGLRLRDVFISSAGRCAPPDNKPTREELVECQTYLDLEWSALKEVRGFLALGSIAFDTTLRLLQRHGVEVSKGLRFGHGAEFKIGKWDLFASYHPSRQNTQTGRLTAAMWDEIFRRARERVDGYSQSD